MKRKDQELRFELRNLPTTVIPFYTVSRPRVIDVTAMNLIV